MPGTGWRFGEAMAAPAKTFLQSPDRRYFLWSLAGLGLSPKLLRSEKRSDASYRFLTAECEVRMSVQFLANSSTEGFHFRDRLTNRAFCLSANGEENRGCLERFVGAMAIARYDFRSRRHSPVLLNLRERVMTIDNDSRMNPPPPFERDLCRGRRGCERHSGIRLQPERSAASSIQHQASRRVAASAPGFISQWPAHRLSHCPLEAHARFHKPGRRHSGRWNGMDPLRSLIDFERKSLDWLLVCTTM